MRPSHPLSRVALTVLALLAGSLGLVATAAPAHAAAVDTVSHLARTDADIKYGQAVTFTGWVTQAGHTAHGYPGTVLLQRKIVGQTAWRTVSSRELSSTNATPTWTSKPSASAYYRLHFQGISGAANPSTSVALKVTVRRNLNDHLRKTDRLYYGKVAPSYAGRVVYVQKTTCAYPRQSSCRWSLYKAIRTNRTNNWSVRLPAYARTTFFRAYIAPSNGYAGSLSNLLISTRRG